MQKRFLCEPVLEKEIRAESVVSQSHTSGSRTTQKASSNAGVLHRRANLGSMWSVPDDRNLLNDCLTDYDDLFSVSGDYLDKLLTLLQSCISI